MQHATVQHDLNTEFYSLIQMTRDAFSSSSSFEFLAAHAKGEEIVRAQKT